MFEASSELDSVMEFGFYATNVRKYDSAMTVTHNSSTLQHYNVKGHQLTK